MTNSNNTKVNTSWLTKIEDANDGTGDGILTFPPELCEMKGWKEGTTLYMEAIDGALHISDKPFQKNNT